MLKKHLANDLSNDTEIQFLCDTERHHYQVLNIGWTQQRRRTYGVIIHVDIKDDKIWIQRDGTEIGIANELLEAGVPQQDIVLAFYSLYKHQFTEFAIG
ncbi:MAG: XisI protein [Cyanobacteria bacterium P01_E01_bin.42]